MFLFCNFQLLLDVDKTHKSMQKLMGEGTWNANDCCEMEERLFKLLTIKNSGDTNEQSKMRF